MFLHNRYEVIEILGEGNMGKVVKARDTQLADEVAIKEIILSGNVVELEQKIKEHVKYLRKLKSKFLVSVYDVFTEDQKLYIVSELGSNQTLRQYIKLKLSKADREKLAVAIVKAAGELHNDGIVHGDISPDNILIGKDGEIRFIDPVLLPPTMKDEIAHGLGISGTAKYMAPELFHPANTPTQRTDVYSVGVVIFEILNGHPPVEGKTFLEVAFSATQFDINVENELCPQGFSQYLVIGVKKALQRDAIQRFGNCEKFYNYLCREFQKFRSKKLLKFVLAISSAVVLTVILIVIGINFVEQRRRGYWGDIVDMPSEQLLSLRDSAIIKLSNIGKAPFYLRQSKNGNGLFTCNAHSPYMSFIRTDGKTATIGSKITLEPWHCQDLAYIGASKVLLTDPVDNVVLLLDLGNNKILHIFSNSVATRYFLHPDAIVVTGDGKKAIIGNWKGGAITVINVKKEIVEKVIPVHGGPSGIAITPDGKFAFVSHTEVRYNPQSNETEGVVSVINLSHNNVIKEIANAGKASSDIKILPDGQTAVTANQRGPTISFIDIAGMSKITDLNLYNGSPVDIAVSQKTPYLFVANYNHPFIHIIDYRSKQIKVVLFSKSFGRESNGISLSPDESLICITNTAIGEVVCTANPFYSLEKTEM